MINELKETHNQNVDQRYGFHHLLDEMSIPYQEEGLYLNVGEMPVEDGWALFLSVNTELIPELVKLVGPLLFESDIAFSLIKDKEEAARKNGFWYGANEVGRIIIIYTTEQATTRSVINGLSDITKDFRGPQVNDGMRISEIIYVTYMKCVDKEEEDGATTQKRVFVIPSIKKLPFKVEKKYQFWKKKRLLKRRYVPLVMLGRSPKGDLLKSVDLKGVKFNWCFIKEGKQHVFSDSSGRDIKDRLQWQAKVLEELSGHVPVPKFIDYFEQGDEVYLVMELLDGIDLLDKIEEVYQKRKWSDLPLEAQQQLLTYYLEVLRIIGKMHQMGYIHRDATARNFMVLRSGEVYTIDLELAYNVQRKEPTPPYTLGAFGYVAPEQLNLLPPLPEHDVYTMGALLLHTLTGMHPANYIDRNCEVNIAKVKEDIQDELLLDIVLRCLDMNAQNRPELNELNSIVKSIFL